MLSELYFNYNIEVINENLLIEMFVLYDILNFQ